MTLDQITPGRAIAAAWVLWALSWLAAAAWTRKTEARAGYFEEFPGRLLFVIGGLILFGVLQLPRTPLAWPVSETLGWLMLACVVAGFAFAWWARIHLGALWSGTVTRKQDHRIVDTGPYALVRHPIYTGALISAVATAIYRGRIEAAVGVAVLVVALWLQARLEERFLSRELGAKAYAAYSARVPMLIPFAKGRPA